MNGPVKRERVVRRDAGVADTMAGRARRGEASSGQAREVAMPDPEVATHYPACRTNPGCQQCRRVRSDYISTTHRSPVMV